MPLDAALPADAARLGRWRVTLGALLAAALCLPFADLGVTTASPGRTFEAIGAGFLRPDFGAIDNLPEAVAMTLAVAFAGVAIGSAAGFALALGWGSRLVRMTSLCLRGVHELIWALLIMTVTGPTPTTAVVALALAYAGIFAKVFAEILEETDPRPRSALPNEGRGLSGLVYAKIAPALPQLWTYLAYRVECGIRSSAVLGFVGLPTLGFELETLFRQGRYDGSAAVLLLTYALIITVPIWLRRSLLPLYVAASLVFVWFAPRIEVSGLGLWRLLTVDLVPAPLRNADLGELATWSRLGDWLWRLLGEQLLPGLGATLVLGLLAMIMTGVVAIASFPLIVTALSGRAGSWLGHALLVVLRSTPEYMLVFVAVQALGPSMLPAIIALSLHNGAIIAHLIGRQAQLLEPQLRVDRPRGLDLYAYELVPRLAAPFFAYLLYRAEIILRESIILGMLGIATLGFFIDSAIGELRLDRALVLIVGMIATTALVDVASRTVRRRMGLAAVSSG